MVALAVFIPVLVLFCGWLEISIWSFSVDKLRLFQLSKPLSELAFADSSGRLGLIMAIIVFYGLAVACVIACLVTQYQILRGGKTAREISGEGFLYAIILSGVLMFVSFGFNAEYYNVVRLTLAPYFTLFAGVAGFILHRFLSRSAAEGERSTKPVENGYCPYCGKPLPKDAAFCHVCGHAIPRD